MSSRHATTPPARSWREIPQQVNRRAMSSGSRRRVVLGGLRTAGIVAVLVGAVWGGWEVAATFQSNSRKVTELAPSAPVKDLVLVTDGVLDQAWLARTLALPKNTSLMALDLFQLRTRVLASGQVRSATLTRGFPATLAVSLAERMPVARLSAQDREAEPRTLLVARDGVVYEGVGYDPAMVQTLPWLAGVKLLRAGGSYQPIAGMESVADLLAKAKLEAEHLYDTWRVVSLARLDSDGELEVVTREGTKITFGLNEDFFRQLANLDAILDAAKAHPEKSPREINLAVGAQVPVAFSAGEPADATRPKPPAPAAPSLVLPVFPNH